MPRPVGTSPVRKFGDVTKREGLSDIPAAVAEYTISEGVGGKTLGVIGVDAAGSVTHADGTAVFVLGKDMHWLRYHAAASSLMVSQTYPVPDDTD